MTGWKPGDRAHLISAWFTTVPADLSSALISYAGEPCKYEVVAASGGRAVVACLTKPDEGVFEVETSHLVPINQ